MRGFDKILGDATMGGIGSAIGGGVLGGMVIGAA
jgi:hypothetical protein